MDGGSSHDKTPSPTPSPKPKYSFDEHQNTHWAFQYDMLNHFFMNLVTTLVLHSSHLTYPILTIIHGHAQ